MELFLLRLECRLGPGQLRVPGVQKGGAAGHLAIAIFQFFGSPLGFLTLLFQGEALFLEMFGTGCQVLIVTV